MTNKIYGVFVSLLFALTVFNVSAETLQPELLIHQARQKAQEGDFESAAALYHEVLQTNKHHTIARKELAQILVEAQVQDPYSEHSDPVLYLEKMAKPNPSTERFSLSFLSNGALGAKDFKMRKEVLLVLNKLQYGENKAAIKIAKNLQVKHPDHPVPYNLLGLAWQGIGEPTKAEELFKQALSLEQNFHAARMNLAELELHLGEYDAAQNELNVVLKTDQHNRRASLMIAELYALEGKSDLAQKWYSKVSEQL